MRRVECILAPVGGKGAMLILPTVPRLMVGALRALQMAALSSSLASNGCPLSQIWAPVFLLRGERLV